MLFAVITTLLVAATQTDALFTVSMPPPDVPTFEVTLAGEAPFFAGMRINGRWVTDYNTEIRPTQNVEFVLDTPFSATAPFTVPMRRVQTKYEPPAMRRARLETIWTSNGYTFLETASGWKAVRKEDIELAERSRRMAALQKKETVAQFSINGPAATPASTGGLNARMLLILRATIIVIGCLAAGVALKFILSKETDWKTLE